MPELGVFARCDGTTLPIVVPFDVTVQQLMEAVGKAFDKPHPPRLQFQGQDLDPDQDVADTGVSSQSMLEVLAGGIPFVHESPFDENGIFYYMGTLGKEKPYKNPSTKRKLVKAEKRPDWGSPAGRWVGRTCHYNRTDNVVEPFFQVDLRVATMMPTHYSMCFGRDVFDYLLKSWVLKGSMDGEEWDDLDRRTDNPVFRDGSQGGRKPYYHGTFDIVSKVGKPYRFFRVVGLGNWDSDQPDDEDPEAVITYLHICKFELYGLATFNGNWQEDTWGDEADGESDEGAYYADD
eukprot:Hpha_TRINITY_DN12182_c0_g1::TRINITY_DN12182_c0_g1_i1::g.81988::m.81988